ncbi:hypothetical protein [Bdellovibrio sp. HCB288]|uniref:hypothetical protein n=1 Tax=Bdellovibrio sp. HCB288 TaxID=3394355 RepID=UPI0039B62B88
MESFLIALILAAGERLAAKGKIKMERWSDFQAELKSNQIAASKYQEVVNSKAASREERRKAEDELLN